MDVLGTIGSLPKKIGDVTDSISKGADSLDNMVGKMDTAVKGAQTQNPVREAVVRGLSKTTGALKKGTTALSNAGKAIQVAGTNISNSIQPLGTAAQSVKQSLRDLQNCQKVMLTSALVVNAVVDSCSGHFHPRVNEQVLRMFDGQWDSWAKTINGIYERLSPTWQTNILEKLAKDSFGDNVFYLGSAIKNESAGIFGGIADFEDALHAFRGSYRNPIEAAKKIEKGVKNIVNATERVANSVNNMIMTYQKGMGQKATGNPILTYIGNLHNTKAVSAVNKILTAGGGAATLFTDAGNLQNALKSKDPKAIYSDGKKTIDDAKTILRGLKDADKATKVTNLISGTSTGSAVPVGSQSAQEQPSRNEEENDDANTDSYVCSGATMKCTFGDKKSKLTVYPDRTVFQTGQPMANISDHTSLYNIAPFGKCHTTRFPATGAATAANHGHLTPMPCIPGTMTKWQQGKDDYIIKGGPALLKSSFCRCCYGGVITITDDGQRDMVRADLSKMALMSSDEMLKKGKNSTDSLNGFVECGISALRGEFVESGLNFFSAVNRKKTDEIILWDVYWEKQLIKENGKSCKNIPPTKLRFIPQQKEVDLKLVFYFKYDDAEHEKSNAKFVLNIEVPNTQYKQKKYQITGDKILGFENYSRGGRIYYICTIKNFSSDITKVDFSKVGFEA